MQFFYVKDSVLVLPLPQGLPELQRQIIATISEMDCDMLQQVWAETDYWLDVKKKNLGEGLLPYVARMFQSFLRFKCTDFIDCVREL